MKYESKTTVIFQVLLVFRF